MSQTSLNTPITVVAIIVLEEIFDLQAVFVMLVLLSRRVSQTAIPAFLNLKTFKSTASAVTRSKDVNYKNIIVIAKLIRRGTRFFIEVQHL